MTESLIRFDITDEVATITLDSPANRNALGAQLRGELLDRLDEAVGSELVRVIVLTHTGTVFCAGMDLKEAGKSGLSGDEVPRILETIWTSPKPVIARLTGPARAGGVGIVAACDFAVATTEVTFAFTEVRIGVIPALISATVVPRMAPRAVGELFLTGEAFDALRAAELGLISQAVPYNQVDAEIAHLVAELKCGAPLALAGVKALLQRQRRSSLSEDLLELSALSASFFDSPEAKEGMAAFREKRSPAWVRTD